MDDLEYGPFGRRLRLLIHHLPKTPPNRFHWEIERGFHLQVLSSDLFELRLRPQSGPHQQGESPLFNPSVAPSSSGRLLLWQKPEQDATWEEFSQALVSSQPWEAALILDNTTQYLKAAGSLIQKPSGWQKPNCPVIGVFQDSPPSTFFTVEKNLFVLGRVGRRLERYAKLRRLLPW